MAYPTREEFDDSRAFQETTLRHIDDMVLRRHGFSIVARPKGGPPLWAHHGDVYTEAEAMHQVCAEERDAEKPKRSKGMA